MQSRTNMAFATRSGTIASPKPRIHHRFIKTCFQTLLLPFVLLLAYASDAQDYTRLQHLEGYKAQTYFSSGAQEKAIRMATRLNKVIAFYQEQLEFTPSVTLLILSPADWSTYTRFPFYGMPHYTSNKTLIVASEDNDYWKSMIPQPGKIPNKQSDAVKEIYSDGKGGLTMEPFFDLLAIHELGHAYHNQGGLLMQRKWMGELFPNILLHTYIAENEPELLPALTAFPQLVVATTDESSLNYTSLEDLETHYNEIGPNYPQNYGWYQCRWHIAAGKIYDEGGIEVLKKLWDVLKIQQTILPDDELAALFETKVHKVVADVQLNWNGEK